MARAVKLNPDATLADIVPGLDDAEAYLRRILWSMRQCQKAHGAAEVRIAVTGKRPQPSYRIDGPNGVYGAYGGQSHEAFTAINAQETHWSSRAMALDAVLPLHDDLRKGRAGPPNSA